MANVPYTPYATVAVPFRESEKAGPFAGPESFGAIEADAMRFKAGVDKDIAGQQMAMAKQSGDMWQQGAKVVTNFGEMLEDTQVQKAVNSARSEMDSAVHGPGGYLSQEADNAVSLHGAARSSLSGIAKSHMEDLSPSAQAKYNKQVFGHYQSLSNSVDNHYVGEAKRAAHIALQGASIGAISSVNNDPSEENTIAQGEVVRAASSRVYSAFGLPPDATRALIENDVAKTYGASIDSLLAGTGGASAAWGRYQQVQGHLGGYRDNYYNKLAPLVSREVVARVSDGQVQSLITGAITAPPAVRGQGVSPSGLIAAGEYGPAIIAAAGRYGMDPAAALATASVESDIGRASDSPGSQYKGVMQLGDHEWAKVGGTPENRSDKAAQIELGVKHLSGLTRVVERTIGRPAEGWEVYMGHQQGPTGLKALLEHPTMKAAEALDRFAPDPSSGERRIQGNIPGDHQLKGNTDITSRQFLDIYEKKYNDRYMRFAAKGVTPETPGGNTLISSAVSDPGSLSLPANSGGQRPGVINAPTTAGAAAANLTTVTGSAAQSEALNFTGEQAATKATGPAPIAFPAQDKWVADNAANIENALQARGLPSNTEKSREIAGKNYDTAYQQMDSARKDYTSQFTDTLLSARDGRDPPMPPVPPRAFTPEDIAEFHSRYGQAQTFGAEMRSFKRKPAAEILEGLAKREASLSESAGDYSLRRQELTALGAGAAAVIKARVDDPAQAGNEFSVATGGRLTPGAVTTALQNALTGNQGVDPTVVPGLLREASRVQGQIGIAPADQRFLSKADAASVSLRVNSLDPATINTTALIQKLGTAVGRENSTQFFAELTANGLQDRFLVPLISSHADLHSALASVETQGGAAEVDKRYKMAAPSGFEGQLNRAIAAETTDLRHTFQHTAGGEAMYNRLIGQLIPAMQSYALSNDSGMDPTALARRGAAWLQNDFNVQAGGRVFARIPKDVWGRDQSAGVHAYALRQLGEIQPGDIDISHIQQASLPSPADTPAPQNPAYIARQAAESVRDSARWVSNSGNTGMSLVRKPADSEYWVPVLSASTKSPVSFLYKDAVKWAAGGTPSHNTPADLLTGP